MQVFICYAREDYDEAIKIFNYLNCLPNIEPWIDKENLLPGSNWSEEINRVIENSRYVILILSKNSVNKRGYIQKEIKELLEHLDEFPPEEIYLIPIRIDECEPNHKKLKQLHWVDIYDDWENGISRIYKALKIDEIDIKNQKQSNRESALKLVDVSVIDTKDGFPVLDIKVRNTGKIIAFMKKAIFDIKDVGVFKLMTDIRTKVEKVSWNYDVVFGDIPELIEHPISQSIAGNDVDRFTFTLTQNISCGPVLYKFNLHLIYNENNETLSTKPILLHMKPLNQIMAYTTMSDKINEEAVQHNREMSERFSMYDGVMSEEYKKYFHRRKQGC